jgi:hypothetical protein
MPDPIATVEPNRGKLQAENDPGDRVASSSSAKTTWPNQLPASRIVEPSDANHPILLGSISVSQAQVNGLSSHGSTIDSDWFSGHKAPMPANGQST